jgi:glucose/arabinose dehydrogenase
MSSMEQPARGARPVRWPRKLLMGVGALFTLAALSSCAASKSEGDRVGQGPVGGHTASSGDGASARMDSGGDKSRAARTSVRLVKIGSFNAPIFIAAPPGDRRRTFVVEKAGRIAILLDGHKLGIPFLDISSEVGSTGNEQGLLSMAFAPDYATSGVFYVYYTDQAGDIHVDRLRRSAGDPNRADPHSARGVISISHRQYPNHNGGQLQFGPDGCLYLGVGDGGSEGDPAGNGQNTDVLLGKLLRIAPKPNGGYTIPLGNPFAGEPGKRAEIWAYGLRNPWRFSFDRKTGALIVGDVGQDQQEEVDFAPRGSGAGANYGWSVFEGDRRNKPGVAPHAVAPVLIARHSEGYCAIIGGYVVRDRTLGTLYGRYLYGDLCHPEIQAVALSAGRARDDRATGLSVKDLASFGEDGAGRVYAVSLDGPVYRLAG